MKKKGFILLEVTFGIAFAGAAILSFFSFLNHLNNMTLKTLNSVKKIEELPIYYSNIVLDNKSVIKNYKDDFFKNIYFEEINISEFPKLKNFQGIFIKDEKSSDFFYLNYNNFSKLNEENKI